MLISRPEQQSYSSTQAKDDQRLMLFDLDFRGHHAGYIQHLVNYWCSHELPGYLDILVSQKFLQKHAGIAELVAKGNKSNIQFVSITAEEEANLFDSSYLESSFKGRVVRAFQEWKLLQKYVKALGTTHCFLMYLDTVLLRFSVGGRFACPFSALYFRPIFHYSTFSNYIPQGREPIWQWRDNVCLSRLLQYPTLQTLFCLDPFAVECINQSYKTTKAAYLPDPVQIYSCSEAQVKQLQQDLGVQLHRKVFLLFGALSERKGVRQLLDAIQMLPTELGEQLCLLLVGPIEPNERAFLEGRLAEIGSSLPVQVIRQHEFVRDEAIQPYFQAADVVLAPYQRHIGMSAILVRAAAAHKPVLSSDFGLMGEITRQRKLGLAVDSTQPAEIAKALKQFLVEPEARYCDRQATQQFADQNAAEHFAAKIFQCLLRPTASVSR